MPTRPGIYIYKNVSAKIIYIGKAKNLRQRVKSYFQPPVTLGPKTAALVAQISTIEHIEVNSELEALLLESRLIKKHQPQYNLISKDDKSPYYIHLSRETYPRPVINHQSTHALAGPFLSGYVARQILRQFRQVAPYCLAARPVKKPCFYSHLGVCNSCPGTGTSPLIYQKNISRLRRLLRGEFHQVSSQLTKNMRQASSENDFESAARFRDQLNSLSTLLARPVLPDAYLVNPNLISDLRQESLAALKTALIPFFPKLENLDRIEMYDIANLQGTSATAAMTVAVLGELAPRNYRHFTIKFMPKQGGSDDVGMLAEVLNRRLLRKDWPTANLVVLDGGKPQLSIIPDLQTQIPIIALAKRTETIFIPGVKYQQINLPRRHPGLRLLQSLRDEAHRFSRRLHHKHRAKLIPRP